MLKTSAFFVTLMVSSTIAGTSNMFLYQQKEIYESTEMHRIQDENWPPVHVAYNFQVDFDFQIYEPTLKKLIPYSNMNGTQLVDSIGNRERVDVWLQMDKLGMLPIR